MFQIVVTGETLPELEEKLNAHLELLKGGESEKPKGRTSKKTDTDDEKPKDKVKHTEASVREALVGTGWPKEHMAAFTKKFGKDNKLKDADGEKVERIPQIPTNQYAAYLEELNEVAGMTDKKRKEHLEDFLDDNL